MLSRLNFVFDGDGCKLVEMLFTRQLKEKKVKKDDENVKIECHEKGVAQCKAKVLVVQTFYFRSH